MECHDLMSISCLSSFVCMNVVRDGLFNQISKIFLLNFFFFKPLATANSVTWLRIRPRPQKLQVGSEVLY